MIDAYIALGSNQGRSDLLLQQALKMLAALPQTELRAVSRFYSNRPMGPHDQPDYVNAVAAITTDLGPILLLNRLLGIERRLGRVRNGKRWIARTMDLDLLLYGQQQIRHPRLTVPHPGLPERDFVVLPLAEVAPAELPIPGLALTLGELARNFNAAALLPQTTGISVDY